MLLPLYNVHFSEETSKKAATVVVMLIAP